MASPGTTFFLLTLVIIAGCAYFVGAQRLRSRGHRWPNRRLLAATGGLICLATAVTALPGPSPTFPAHVVQHLLLTMVSPVLLALSAPVTLALRTLPSRGRRLLLIPLHSPVSRFVTLAPVVLLLDIGGMYAYYLSSLYDVSHRHPWLQGLVHVHMFLAGCLLAWYLISRDPMPHRPSTRTVMTVLLIAATAHDVLAKLMFAHQLPTSAGTTEQLRVGAQIMFYGGSIVETTVATILMATWYARGARGLRHLERRARTGPSPSGVTGVDHGTM